MNIRDALPRLRGPRKETMALARLACAWWKASHIVVPVQYAYAGADRLYALYFAG